MNEYELLQIIQASRSQFVVLITQIVAVNFAMIVAIYYFLNRAGLPLKIAAFFLYLLGSFMFLALAIEQANVQNAVRDGLRELEATGLGPVGRQVIDSVVSPWATALEILVNLSYWALWICVSWLLFFWKKRDGET